MKSPFLVNLIISILFIFILALAPGVVRDSLDDQNAKSEIALINHVMYGVFSVDAWKARISEILVAEIEKINLTSTAEGLRGTIEGELNAVIDKLNNQLRESNDSTVGGRIKQALIDAVVNVNAIKKGVPRYTDAIITQLGKPETQNSLKSMAAKELKTYLKKSFTPQNMEPVQAVLDQTGTKSVPEATAKLHAGIKAHQIAIENRCYAIIALAVVMFAIAGFKQNRTPVVISLLFAALITMLFIGVTIPMIDLEAKISELSFVLLGHKVSFENQILYFQSKSVVDVFWLMITSPGIKMKAVGLLMVTFSIIFPILKMTASLVYFFSEKRRKSRALQFFAFKIGKWSMADVMVIAIFMAYIGFNGIFDAQFKKMTSVVPHDVGFFTTNGTTLQMGYFVFISYVLLALVLSSYVHVKESTAGGPRQSES